MARVAGSVRSGEVSWWWRALGGPPAPRPALTADVEADVCIVGAGFTGLWAAYHLAVAEPTWRIVQCESRFAGYGASGRNGGWLTAALPGDRDRWAARAGRTAVLAMHDEMEAAVRGVARATIDEGIDCDLLRGGELDIATAPAQWQRIRDGVRADQGWRRDTALLGPAELADRIAVRGALGAAFSPHCARLQPAALVAGLAGAVERRGVRIAEATPALTVEPHRVRTPAGTVSARTILRCTEGFTAALPGLRRRWLPMNSSMIVTEPLSADAWSEIGWTGGETFSDAAHAYVYAQRTADGRIALGGRGRPYRYGSRTDTDGATPGVTVAALTEALHRLLPATAGAGVEHAWSGVLAVPRDWCASVGLDRATGLGWAGGYVGHGVASAYLAGLTLADLVLGRDTARCRLPRVGAAARDWEPEPLRWLGVQAMYAAYRAADAREARPGAGAGSARIARWADRVSGR